MSQSFEANARERGLCPVIVSTLRDPKEEIATVETLISYAVDALFIVGATNPDALGRLCQGANVPHIFVDLPGPDAPSVISDNYRGAFMLTEKILSEPSVTADPDLARPYFIGGIAGDYATSRRIEAFRACVRETTGNVGDDQIIPCGYALVRRRAKSARFASALAVCRRACFSIHSPPSRALSAILSICPQMPSMVA